MNKKFNDLERGHKREGKLCLKNLILNQTFSLFPAVIIYFDIHYQTS